MRFAFKAHRTNTAGAHKLRIDSLTASVLTGSDQTVNTLKAGEIIDDHVYEYHLNDSIPVTDEV